MVNVDTIVDAGLDGLVNVEGLVVGQAILLNALGVGVNGGL